MQNPLFLNATDHNDRVLQFAEKHGRHVHVTEHVNPAHPRVPLLQLSISNENSFQSGRPLRNVIVFARVDSDEARGQLSSFAVMQQFVQQIEAFDGVGLHVLVDAVPHASDENPWLYENDLTVRGLLSSGFRQAGNEKFAYNWPGTLGSMHLDIADSPFGVQVGAAMIDSCFAQGELVSAIKLDSANIAAGNFCYATRNLPQKVKLDFAQSAAALRLPLTNVVFDWHWLKDPNLGEGIVATPTTAERLESGDIGIGFRGFGIDDFVVGRDVRAWTVTTEPCLFCSTLSTEALLQAFDVNSPRRSDVLTARERLLRQMSVDCGVALNHDAPRGAIDDELSRDELSNELIQSVMFTLRWTIYSLRFAGNANDEAIASKLINAACDFAEKAGIELQDPVRSAKLQTAVMNSALEIARDAIRRPSGF